MTDEIADSGLTSLELAGLRSKYATLKVLSERGADRIAAWAVDAGLVKD